MEWFEKYQTFVAGLIGFLGVIATINANGNQNQKQLREQRAQEARALRCTLIEELRLISDSFVVNMEDLSNQSIYPIAYIPSTPHIQAFKQLVPNFGLLTTDEIRKTMLAYQLIQELPDRLRFLQTMDSSVHMDNFVAIDEHQSRNVVKVFDSMLSPVIQAIAILEHYDRG
ncbi:hypothetical protein AB4463_19370 [Vibrio cyclitrophicus]